MLFPTFGLALGFAATVSAVALEARVCGDNCARAVLKTNNPGAADCTAFLHTTVTPVVTATTTLTVSTGAISSKDFTETETVIDAATVTEHATVSTLTTTLPVLFKRAAKTTPTYASACSGVARYTSACSCLGIFASTITANAVSSTVTATETVFTTTEVASSAVATATVVEIASTTTQTIPVTATLSVKPERRFAIQIAEHNDQSFVGRYLHSDGYNFDYTPVLADAQVFQINYDNGFLYDGGNRYMSAVANSFNLPNWEEFSPNWWFVPFTCSHDNENILSCTSAQDYHIFGDAFGRLIWANDRSQLDWFGMSAMTLKVVFL